MTVFYFIRHGEPEWSLTESNKLKGHSRDLVPLTEKGRQQAKATSKDTRLKNAGIIISSPYTRALQTAAILSKELGIDLKVEFDLREWQPDLSFQYDSMEALHELTNDYEMHKGVYPINETRLWETQESVKNRITGVLDKYLEYSSVIIVAHSMIFGTICPFDKMACCEILEHNRQ